MSSIWQRLQKIAFIGLVILVITSLLLYGKFGNELALSEIQSYITGFGIWAPLVFIFIYCFGTIFLPSTPFMAIAGILFGFRYGLAYTIIGGLLSAIITFYIARHLGKDRADQILEHKYLKLLAGYNKRLEQGAVWDLIILRITPIMPFNVLNILMGLSRISTRDYILGTIFGLLPSNIITVYFGIFIAQIF